MGAQEKIDKIAAFLKKEGAKKVVLFGSRAKGFATRYSDIDIAIDLTLEFRAKRKLREKIDDLSGLYSVDLVFLDEANKQLLERIEKEGIVLYEKE